jgi:hypothetical protein
MKMNEGRGSFLPEDESSSLSESLEASHCKTPLCLPGPFTLKSSSYFGNGPSFPRTNHTCVSNTNVCSTFTHACNNRTYSMLLQILLKHVYTVCRNVLKYCMTCVCSML